jgi:ribose/xylose/arabinose/galactoside ABC-type transport system permease subunit
MDNANNKGFARVIEIINEFKIEFILILLIIVSALISPSFMTLSNWMTILGGRSAMKGIIAFGMTFVIICGEIDLSIGSTVALSGIVAAKIMISLETSGMSQGMIGLVAVLCALLVGAAIGAVNGFFMVTFNMPSFIVTLGMVNIGKGLSQIIAPYTLTGLPGWFKWFGAGRLFQTSSTDAMTLRNLPPVPALFLIIAFLAAWLVLKKTKFGRAVYAVGGNAEAARLSGINVKKVKMIVMMIVSVAAAFAGIIMSSSSNTAAFTFGEGWEMDVIASVIIGGASMAGGSGNAIGTLVGVIFFGVVNNIMTLFGVGTAMQYVVLGALVIIAVLLNSIKTKKG